MVLVLALGSGAVATVFSAMNALLLRPLPGVTDPATLVALQPARRDGGTSEQIGWNRYVLLRDHARTVDGIAVWGRAPFTIADDGAGTSVLGNLVSANYFACSASSRPRPLLRRGGPPRQAPPGAGRLARVLADRWAATRRDRTRVSVNGHRSR